MLKKTLLLLAFSFFSFGNPFKIDFPQKEIISDEEFLLIQEKLRAIDITPYLDDLYPKDPPKKFLRPWSSSLATKEDFHGRISKSLHQTFVSSHRSPCKQLVKINQGGENCVVCYASLDGRYEDLLLDLPKQLEKVGFNGYFFYLLGGFPNPTGKEIQYCGVPYCFKIFALLEAKKLGFSNVLWIDSALTPLRDPTPLFDWIRKEGCFLKLHESFPKYLLPKTREYLKDLTGVDVLKARYVSAQIIGFDLTRPSTQDFIDQYYKLVELGLPFFSCFPEEYVFASIIGQKPERWKEQPFDTLVFPALKLRGKKTSWAQQQGYFFLQQEH